ncbi:MAG: bifunctional tetrahydrofolate synthase/dihydrofolate synthase, partial [Pseudomonas atacamensis]
MTQCTLGEWLAYLEQLHPSAIDMGLERSQQVASRMGLGQPAPRVITVTGTNGK